jgi:hypothetical protein
MSTQMNRIMDAVLLYTEQEIQYAVNNPGINHRDNHAIELKEQYYKDLLQHFNQKLTRPEKDARKFLKNEIRKLNVQRNPTLLNVLLNGRWSRWLRNYFTGKSNVIYNYKNTLNQYQNKIGMEYNLIRLSDAVKRCGFTQDISNTLQRMIAKGLPTFHIRYADIRNPGANYILHFKMIPGSAAYLFEKFEASLHPKNQYSTDSQTWYSFFPDAEISFTATEAAQLINGRSISKSNNEWIVLDNTDKVQPFRLIQFNLEEALKKLPLQKMSLVEYKNLINTLKSGNSKEVAININGQLQKFRLEASPLSQTVRTFDKSSNRQVELIEIIKESQRQTKKVAEILNKSENKSIGKVVRMR